MFTIVKTARAWWPVTFPGVAEDGTVVQNSFDMLFRLLKVDEVAAFQSEHADIAEKIAGTMSEEDKDKASALAAEVVKLIADNWRGVAAEGVGEIPWSDENLRMLLNEPHAFDGILAAWRACMAAGKTIRAGN